MNNPYMKNVVVTADYVPLETERTVLSVMIQCPLTNADVVYFRGPGFEDIAWQPGEWNPMVGVNLADIEVRGTPGDVVAIRGGSGNAL